MPCSNLPANVKLYLGDCLSILPTLAACSIDAVITDPPYAIPTNVAQGRNVARSLGDLSLIEHSFHCLFIELLRVLTPQGRIFVFCDGVSYPVVFRAAYGKLTTALLVWDKQKIGMGREFRKSHELILHGWLPGTPVVSSDGCSQADIICCPPVPSRMRLHPAQKPIKLILSLLRVCGPTILDPFMGSGVTGLAAVQTGRRFVGIEVDSDYFDLAEKQLENTAHGSRVHGGRRDGAGSVG
jgi:site-specific DNA-methyltransferase (adenine-specific)